MGCRAAMLVRIRCSGQGPKTCRGGQSGPSQSALAASILHTSRPHHPCAHPRLEIRGIIVEFLLSLVLLEAILWQCLVLLCRQPC